jgi:hypothetical protein
MNRVKMMGAAGALVVSSLVGGTMVSAALAAPATTTTSSATTANLGVSDAYLQTYLDTLASELGVDRAELGPAALAAANAAIDAAASAGDISADRASELKDELAALDDPASILVGHGVLGGGPGHGGHGIVEGDAVDAAATALGIDASDLVGQLRGGSSLMEIAVARGVGYPSVVSAVTDAVASDLATAVADGRITQDRSDQIASGLATWLDAGGQPDEGAFLFRHGMGHGPRGEGPMGL